MQSKFNELMNYLQRREKEVNFFYAQLDRWFEYEPDLSLDDRAAILCDVLDCIPLLETVYLDSMHQFVTSENWKDCVPLNNKSYTDYTESFKSFINKLEDATEADFNNVILNHKEKCISLLRQLDYHSVRRIIDEAIADGLSEQHFTFIF